LVAAALRGRLHPRDVGARVGLAETEGTQDRPLEQRGKPGLLLLIRARKENGPRAETVGEDRGPDARAAPVQLLTDDDAAESGRPESPERFRHMEIHEPELVRLRDDVGRMRRVLVVLGRLRPNLLLRELACERSQLSLLPR